MTSPKVRPDPGVLSGVTNHLITPHSKVCVGRECGLIDCPIALLLFVFFSPIRHLDARAYSGSIRLKRRMVSVMATSVGSLSILDAPKKPTMPCVRSKTYEASSGSAIGPP